MEIGIHRGWWMVGGARLDARWRCELGCAVRCGGGGGVGGGGWKQTGEC